jgi:dTDP-4-dehydrorhamnose reductase
MKRIIIFGATGMLGHQVTKVFSQDNNYEIIATYRKKKDLKNIYQDKKNVTFVKYDALKNKNFLNITNKKVHHIINCIGIIKPYINEVDVHSIKKAIFVNGFFPHELFHHFSKKNKNMRFFQIATDCVFNGSKGKYSEKDSHNADDIYGKTKSLGEVNKEKFFNIRCSIIGKELKSYKSLLEWFLNLKQKSKLTGFANHKWNGLTTKAYSEFLKTIIDNNIEIPRLIHVLPSDTVSKYELIFLLKKIFNKKDISLSKINHPLTIDRTLATNNLKLVKYIWSKSIYKKTPSIKDMLIEIKND